MTAMDNNYRTKNSYSRFLNENDIHYKHIQDHERSSLIEIEVV